MKVMPDLALNPQQFELHLLAELEVERAERLVEQQHLGLVHDRAGQGDTLALAAGELGWLAGPEPGQPDHLQRLAHLLAPLAASARAARAGRTRCSAPTVMCGNSA